MKTKHIMFKPMGVCSQVIDVTADEYDVIQQVFFIGGCNGTHFYPSTKACYLVIKECYQRITCLYS